MRKPATGFSVKILVVALCFFITSCGGPEKKYTKHIEKSKEYYASSQYKEAVIEFKNAIQIKPNDPQAHYNLGLSYLKVGGPAYIPAGFKSLVNKTNLDGTILLANINAAKGKLGEAKKLLQAAADAHPESTKPLLALSTVYLASGERDSAKNILRKAIEKDGSVEPRIALAGVFLFEKNFKAAEDELNGALKDNPKSVAVLSALTNFYIWTRQGAMAEQTAA